MRAERHCEVCGKPFEPKTHRSRYCSRSCLHRRHRKRREEAAQICEECGGTILPKPRRGRRRQRFCSRACLYASMRGPRAANWRGGRWVTAQGYVYVHTPEHPRATGTGHVFEHRLVMEQQLGRLLEPGETVHHINGDPTDNRPENLQLRWGRHARGVVFRCADCGSINVIASQIAP